MKTVAMLIVAAFLLAACQSYVPDCVLASDTSQGFTLLEVRGEFSHVAPDAGGLDVWIASNTLLCGFPTPQVTP